MKSWLVLVILAYIAWSFTDINSSSPAQTLAAPLLLAAIVIVALCKLLVLAKPSRVNASGDGSNIDVSGSNNCGGDGGGD